MAKRGRKSPGDLMASVVVREPRVLAPPGLKREIAEAFQEIVDGAPAAQFTVSDGPLILRLAQVRASLAKNLELAEFLALVKAELALARALRLSPASRLATRAAALTGTPRGEKRPWEL